MIVPAWRAPGERPPEPALAALRKAHKEGARLAAFDSGVFVLAAAGILDGRTATTHWMYAPALARHHRKVKVDARSMQIDGGDVVTGAGAAAGLDLCLYLVRTDHGAEAASSLARRLVIGPGRRSGQAAYFDRHLPSELGAGTPIGDAMAWALDHLAEPFDVDEFAKHSSMSRRTFDRRFLETTGTTPLRWVNSQRVIVAQRILESTDLPVDEVARRSGSPRARRCGRTSCACWAPSRPGTGRRTWPAGPGRACRGGTGRPTGRTPPGRRRSRAWPGVRVPRRPHRPHRSSRESARFAKLVRYARRGTGVVAFGSGVVACGRGVVACGLGVFVSPASSPAAALLHGGAVRCRRRRPRRRRGRPGRRVTRPAAPAPPPGMPGPGHRGP